jgi:hypothetical protein
VNLSPAGYSLLLLTAVIGALAAVVMFALLRFVAAARDTRRSMRGEGMETTVLSAALQEAVEKLKAQERATGARRGLRAAERRDHLEPHVRAAGRRPRRRASHPQPVGAQDPRAAGIVAADRVQALGT